MSDGTYRGWWIDQVFRAPSISDAVRVALLALAMDMDETGMVKVPRELLASRLARSERRVAGRLKDAVESGFIQRTTRGQKHVVATYQATVPDHILSETPGCPAEDSQGVTLQHPEADSQQDTRGSGRGFLSETHGGPAETASLYKDHARAHSRDHLSLQAQQPEVDERVAGGVVVPLFEEQMTTGKKHTSAKRAQVEPRPPVAREDFDKFWAAYPRRIAKGAARKAWDKALKNGADPEEIIWGARAYASLPRDPADGLKYVAHPATWLNGERWTDEADPEPEPRPSTTTSRVAQVDDALAEFRRLTGTHAADARPHTIKGELLR